MWYLLFLIPAISLNANVKKITSAYDLYEPGVFHPLGPTLMFGNTDVRKRPYFLIAYDSRGKVLEKSVLQYNSEGRIISEKILDSQNRYKGEVHYLYDAQGNVIEEKYVDVAGKVVAKKVRHYKSNQLVRMDVYSDEKLSFTRYYTYKQNQILGKEEENKNIVPFSISIRDGLIQSVIYREKDSSMEIHYSYQDGRLIERFKKSGDALSKSVYNYDQENRLQKYTYYDLVRGNWEPVKTIELVYADQI